MFSIDSAFDLIDGSGSSGHVDASVHIRVVMPEDPNFQTIIMLRPVDLVWTLKQKVLAAVNQELKDPMNYGLYSPPSNMRVGKFMDEERPVKEYPLSGPIGLLEFKYKKRLYKTDVNPLKLKKMHTQAELKLFLELVRKADIDQMTMKMNRGFDPNFNSVGKGDTPLTLAVTLPRPRAIILALVSGGAFIDYRNKDGRTPLHSATLCGNKDAIRILLDLGSSPNYKDAKGLTPLSYAMAKDTPSLCIQWLLQERADIGMKDENGWMEIHHACQRGLCQHLEHLLFYGADRNAQTTDTKDTPLHICARFNQEECARLLLFRGADKTLKNASGQVAEQVAMAAGHKEISKVISDFRQEDVELFNEIPKYNEKRRGTISMATLRNLQRSRSNPNLLHQLFQQDPVISATVSQVAGIQYVSNGLIPNGVKGSSHSRSTTSGLFATGTSDASKSEIPVRKGLERIVQLRREPTGFGFILRGPIDSAGNALNFVPTADVPARQYVESVESDSAAVKAGLQAQDFILEINGKNVVLKSHNECVELMRESGEVLSLKVIKVEPLVGTSSMQVVGNVSKVMVHNETTDAVVTTNGSAAATLVGLEALENLDATLDNYDGKDAVDSKDIQLDALDLGPPAEFSSEPEQIDDDLPLPPPPPVSFIDGSEKDAGAVSVEDDELLKLVKVTYGAGVKSSSELEPYIPNESELAPSYKEEANKNTYEEEENVSTAGLALGAVALNSSRRDSVEDSSAKDSSSLKNGAASKQSLPQSKVKQSALPPPMQSKGADISKVAVVTVKDNAQSKSRVSEAPKVLEVTKTTQQENHVTSSMATTPTKAPPPPPPPPPPELFMIGTISRSSVNTVTSNGEKAPVQSSLQKEMDANRKKEESHAALMAAILKRKNVLEVTDSGQMAENIDARVDRTKDRQKIVYRSDKTKEVQSPPSGISGVGLLAAEGGQTISKSTAVKDDVNQAGFSAEAEKIRQAFLLKKSTVAASRDMPKEKASFSTVQSEVSDKRISTDVPKPPPLPVNGAPKAVQINTLDRPKSRPISMAVTKQPVLADVAAIIAQKALARQKNEETGSAQLEPSHPKTTEADPKPVQNSTNTDEVKASIANRKSMFEYSNMESSTVPRNSASKVYNSGAVKNGAGSPPSATLPSPITVSQTTKHESKIAVSTLPSPKVNVTSVSKAKSPNHIKATVVVKAEVSPVNNSQQASPKKQNAISKPAIDADLVIPPPVEFATPSSSEPSFTEVYPSATLRSVSKSSQSNSMMFRARGSTIASDLSATKSFRDKALDTWATTDVGDWLESLDYGIYSAAFAKNNITGLQLAQMKQEQIEAIGVSNVLHRVRIEKEIKKVSGKK